MMRRRLGTAIGWAVLLVALGSIFEGRAQAQDRLVLQLGVRIGYLVGQGWSVDPVLSVAAGLTSSGRTAVALGATIGAGIPLGGQPGRAFHVHAAPELTVFKACPVVVVPISLGPSWAFEGGAPSRLGWQLATSVMVAPTNPAPDYLHPAKGPQPLAGPFYRHLRIAGEGGHHEAGADLRFLILPAEPDRGIGYCGGD
jgi:hypothetical protein